MIELLNIDCMEYMALQPDKSFDLAIVDPPYFSGPEKSGYYGKGYSSLGVPRARHYSIIENWRVPEKEYFIELQRVSKDQIIWDKDNGKSSFADAELAYTSFTSAVRICKYMWNGLHQGSMGGDRSKKETRIHPAQKPVKLYSISRNDIPFNVNFCIYLVFYSTKQANGYSTRKVQ